MRFQVLLSLWSVTHPTCLIQTHPTCLRHDVEIFASGVVSVTAVVLM